MDIPLFARKGATPCFYFSFVGHCFLPPILFYLHQLFTIWKFVHVQNYIFTFDHKKVTYMCVHCFRLRAEDQRNVKRSKVAVCFIRLI